jgi:hypothetical protein
MSIAEWNRTPWYEQRILQEGLYAEQPWIQRAVMMQRADDSLSLGSGLFADLQLEQEQPDDLESFGVQVRRSEVVTPIYRSAATD